MEGEAKDSGDVPACLLTVAQWCPPPEGAQWCLVGVPVLCKDAWKGCPVMLKEVGGIIGGLTCREF